MQVTITGSSKQKKDFFQTDYVPAIDCIWQNDLNSIPGAECHIDLLFDNSPVRKKQLASFNVPIIVVNAVHVSANELPENFVRINGWPGFLEKTILEAARNETTDQKKIETVFLELGKKIEWVRNKPGFISARIISMIINEAYLALEENVSSKEEIDIAMKLGTNYPFGPFEWSKKIGLKNIYSLLEKLAVSDSRYQPATLLTKETFIL